MYLRPTTYSRRRVREGIHGCVPQATARELHMVTSLNLLLQELGRILVITWDSHCGHHTPHNIIMILIGGGGGGGGGRGRDTSPT